MQIKGQMNKVQNSGLLLGTRSKLNKRIYFTDLPSLPIKYVALWLLLSVVCSGAKYAVDGGGI